jgi:hypothetical protein
MRHAAAGQREQDPNLRSVRRQHVKIVRQGHGCACVHGFAPLSSFKHLTSAAAGPDRMKVIYPFVVLRIIYVSQRSAEGCRLSP